jgi:hypothetical protein
LRYGSGFECIGGVGGRCSSPSLRFRDSTAHGGSIGQPFGEDAKDSLSRGID